jgi:hypothetical protein
MDSITFPIVEEQNNWIMELIYADSEAEIEYRKKHFSNGVLRYSYRTEADKLEYCGRLISMYVGADGTQKERREFRCKLPACQKCMTIRANERANDFTDRLDAVEGPLFHLTVSTEREQKRLREWAYRRGYDYISLPTDSDDKEIFINGPVKGSLPIHLEDAKTMAKKLSPVMYQDKSKKVSGKLGKDLSKEGKKEDSRQNNVTVYLREYVFNGKKPTKVEIQIADAKAIVHAIDSLDSFDGKITRENIQEVFTKREAALFAVYKRMGFKVHHFDPVEKVVDLDAVNESWARIEIGKHKFHGKPSSLSPFVRLLVERAMDEHNSKETPELFEKQVDSVAQGWGY